MTTPAVALTIAGSDSSGGAGIQADLRTFGALGVFGATVLTAVTAQNTRGVRQVQVLPPAMVAAQLDAVLEDLPVAAVKTGMLANAALVELVAARAEVGTLPALVVDPVLVAASGDRLLDEEAVAVYRQRLLPHARVLTPNLHEAGVLVGRELASLSDAEAAAHELAAFGPAVVVVKGGHLEGREATDVVVADGQTTTLSAPRVATRNVHGTGCTFASATAAGLACGLDPHAALAQAKRYVSGAIAGAASWQIGAGHGPIDHLGFVAASR